LVSRCLDQRLPTRSAATRLGERPKPPAEGFSLDHAAIELLSRALLERLGAVIVVAPGPQLRQRCLCSRLVHRPSKQGPKTSEQAARRAFAFCLGGQVEGGNAIQLCTRSRQDDSCLQEVKLATMLVGRR